MKLTFVGADHQVTGSCHYLQAWQEHIGGLWYAAGNQSL
jgi:hypothetical protein